MTSVLQFPGFFDCSFQWNPCRSDQAAVALLDDHDYASTLHVLNTSLETVFTWPAAHHPRTDVLDRTWSNALPAWGPCGTLFALGRPDAIESDGTTYLMDIGWPPEASADPGRSTAAAERVIASLGINGVRDFAWGPSGGLAALDWLSPEGDDQISRHRTLYIQMPGTPICSLKLPVVPAECAVGMEIRLKWSPSGGCLMLLSTLDLRLVSTSCTLMFQLPGNFMDNATFSPCGCFFAAALQAVNCRQTAGHGMSDQQDDAVGVVLTVYKTSIGSAVYTRTWEGSLAFWTMAFSSEGSRLYLSSGTAFHVVHFGHEYGGCNSIVLCNAISAACKQLM